MFPINVFADKSDDTFVAAFSRELTQLDYHYGTKTEFLILGDMIDSGLFYVNREDLSYVPDIASDYKIVDDTTIDINLRKNAKFHDGSNVTADDVVYTYNFIVKNEKNIGRPTRAEGAGPALCAEDERGRLAPRPWRRQNPKTAGFEF